MYLITLPGERHEDHIPHVIVKTKKDVEKWARKFAKSVGMPFVTIEYADMSHVHNDGFSEAYDFWVLPVKFGQEIRRT